MGVAPAPATKVCCAAPAAGDAKPPPGLIAVTLWRRSGADCPLLPRAAVAALPDAIMAALFPGTVQPDAASAGQERSKMSIRQPSKMSLRQPTKKLADAPEGQVPVDPLWDKINQEKVS